MEERGRRKSRTRFWRLACEESKHFHQDKLDIHQHMTVGHIDIYQLHQIFNLQTQWEEKNTVVALQNHHSLGEK
jgi:hypothetical protein